MARVVGLVLLMSATGCTNKAAGQIALGIVGAVAAAAARGAVNAALHEAANSSSSSGPDTGSTASACEQERDEWFEAHAGMGEPLPAALRCTPNGAYPELTEPAPDAETAAARAAERTGVTTNLCGSTDTPASKCVQPRAVADFL